MNLNKNVIVAEIGCNHKGEIETAKEMIKVAAKFCYVDVVKFQKRNNRALLSPEEYDAPHPVPYNSYGATYGEHREALEFTIEQHEELMYCCKEWGVEYSCSVWDIDSARGIVSLNPKSIKVPSASNLDFKMLSFLAESFSGEIHVSLGMTTRAEEKAIITLLKKHDRINDVVLYACTSGYPVPARDVCILEVKRLMEEYSDAVKAIGFSGHHNGIALDIAALSYGASYFERHFTLNRTWKGTDHAASLEPDGMRRLIRDIKAVSKALTYKEKEILDIEQEQRRKLKREIRTSV